MFLVRLSWCVGYEWSPLGVFSMIVELIVTITGEWSEERSAEELIWTCLDEIFLVMRKSRRSGILFVSVGQCVGSYVVR